MRTKILFLLMAALFVVSACKKDDDKDDNNNPVSGYPTDKLISYWNFDDNIKDQVGTTPDGTNYGATFVTGKAGKALDFNGENQYVQFSRDKFVTGNAVSASCWIKAPAEAGGLYFLVCSDISLFTNENAGVAISIPGTNNANGAFTPDTWVHLVGTYDGTDIKAYINGVLVGTTNHPGTLYDTDYMLTLGRFFDITEYWKGSIDDLFIYDKALSQSEVTQLYNYHK